MSLSLSTRMLGWGFTVLAMVLSVVLARRAEAVTTYVQPDYEALYDLTFIDELHGWAVGRNSVIFYTQDGGKTWANQHRIKVDNDQDRAFHSVAFSDLYHGVVVGFGGLVMFTSDGGRNWHPTLRFFEDNRALGRTKIARTKVWYSRLRSQLDRACAEARVRSPEGSSPECERLALVDEELASDLERLEQWAATPQPIPVASVRKMDFTSVQVLDESTFLATEGGRFYRSTDGGATWLTLPTQPGNARAAWFSDARKGWVVGHGGLVSVTEDGGASWSDRPISEPSILTAVFFEDESNGWVASETGDLFVTRDGGSSWEMFTTGIGEPIRKIVVVGDGLLFLTTWNGVWYSSGRLDSWDLVPLPSDSSIWQEEAPNIETPILLAVATAGKSSILISGTWGIVMLSEDRALTWKELRSLSKAFVDKRRRQLDLRRSRWGFNMDFGHVQPTGDISERFGPGVTVGFELLGLPGRFKIGAAFYMHATRFKERIVAPESDTLSEERLRLDGTGLSIMLPLISQIMFVQRRRVAFFGTLGVGYVYNGFNMADESAMHLNSESGYKRKRKGVGALQSMTLMWLAPSNNPLVGIFVRVALQESWTWNVDGLQTDLGTRDTADFGTEFWPRLVFGISLYE